MKKIQNAFLHLTALLLIIFLTVGAECFTTADAQAAGRCNSTRISDCLPDDEEFLMDSESNRRILLAPKSKTNFVQYPKKTFCNRDLYGNCIGVQRPNYKKRPCNYQNHCLHKPK